MALHLEDILPAVVRIGAIGQRVLIHMAFNMGVERLRAGHRFISAMQFRFWEAAVQEMMTSDLARQELRRASVLAEMMRTGRDEAEM